MIEFVARDLRCVCCGLINATDRLIGALNNAQNIYGEPLTITSGTRCPKHNAEVGGVPSSAHVSGEAVDVRVSGSWKRKKLAKALDSAGFPRLGFGAGFIHADVSTGLPEGWFTY
jgi:uncharacterized protein YcbK (DUF882 family)